MSVVTSTAHFHPRILQNLEGPVEIPHRSSFLPPIYLWVGQNAHPRLHTHSDREEYRRGRTYVVVVDIDVAVLADASDPSEGENTGIFCCDMLAQALETGLNNSLKANVRVNCQPTITIERGLVI